MGARLIALACAVAVALAPSDALADIELSGEARGVDTRALEDLVRLELGSATALDHVIVRIEAGRAEVEVVASSRRRRGSVSLPEGQVERTIALFVGELARRLDTEPDPPPATAPPAPPPPGAPSANQPATPAETDDADESSRPYLLATMGARLFASSGDLMATPRIEGGLALSDAFRLGVLARYGRASASDVLGTASADMLTGGLAASWGVADLLATGPRIEIGGFAARGEGTNGSSADAFAASGAWELELRARVAGSFALILAIEGGWYARGIELRADDRTVLDVSGPFAGASLGIAFLPAVRRR